MLYISRNAGINKWGVVDTDDGVEEVASLSQLKRYLEMGLTIEGVDSEVREFRGRSQLEIHRVRIYTPPGKERIRQTKSIVMNGLDIRSKDGKILYVSWDAQRLKEGLKIRLSHYGGSCENFIFLGAPTPQTEVFIVLDDRVSVKRQTFKRAFGMYNLCFDIREVTNQKTVNYLYEEYLLGHNGSVDSMDRRILDSPERRELWKTIEVVYNGRAHYHIVPEVTSARVAEKFRAEFTTLVQIIKPAFSHKRPYNDEVQRYIDRMAVDAAFWRSNCQDYAAVKAHAGDTLFALRESGVCNFYSMSRFIHYMEWFTPPKDIRDMYVDLCNRANNWFLDMSEGNL